jgi:hypothetical protein
MRIHEQPSADRVYGRWTVVSAARVGRKSECRCTCGAIKFVYDGGLIDGSSTACVNCKQEDHAELRAEFYRRTGCVPPDDFRTLYTKACNAIERCTKPSCKDWPYYGGRGIRVCKEWLEDSLAFAIHLATLDRYDRDTVDRIDNDGHYEPGNVRFADRSMQNSNRRPQRPPKWSERATMLTPELEGSVRKLRREGVQYTDIASIYCVHSKVIRSVCKDL